MGLSTQECGKSSPATSNFLCLQVRRAAFIHNWQLLGCHGMPRQLLFFEVRMQVASHPPMLPGLRLGLTRCPVAAADSSRDQLCP